MNDTELLEAQRREIVRLNHEILSLQARICLMRGNIVKDQHTISELRDMVDELNERLQAVEQFADVLIEQVNGAGVRAFFELVPADAPVLLGG